MTIYIDKLNLPYFTQDEEASILHYHAWFYLVSIYSSNRSLSLVYVVYYGGLNIINHFECPIETLSILC